MYYQIGISLCKYDWIFQLDDDEEPNEKLLRELRNILEKFSAEVFLINRIEKSIGKVSKQVRFFKRVVSNLQVLFTGDILLMERAKKLNNEYYIFHHDPYTESDLLKKFKKYIIIEAYQWGYKINHTLNSSKSITRLFRALFIILKHVNERFAYFLFANLFLVYYFYQRVLTFGIRNIKRVAIYCLLIALEVNKGFHKYYQVWRSMEDKTPIEWLELQEAQNLTELTGRNGLRNLEKLINKKLKFINP